MNDHFILHDFTFVDTLKIRDGALRLSGSGNFFRGRSAGGGGLIHGEFVSIFDGSIWFCKLFLEGVSAGDVSAERGEGGATTGFHGLVLKIEMKYQ